MRFPFFFLLALSTSVCFAQSPASAPAQQTAASRDVTAVNIANQAISAMGGTAIGQINDCLAQGNVQRPLDSIAPSASFTWKNSGAEFRYEQDGRPTIMTGHGKPAKLNGGKTTRLLANATISDFPAHLAASQLLKRLNDTRYGFAALDDSQAAGRSAARIKTWLNGTSLIQTLTTQIWFIDKATGLPLRVEYTLPDRHNANLQGHFAAELSDWRPVSGVLVPFHITTYLAQLKISDANISTLSFNSGISAADFDGGVQ